MVEEVVGALGPISRALNLAVPMVLAEEVAPLKCLVL